MTFRLWKYINVKWSFGRKDPVQNSPGSVTRWRGMSALFPYLLAITYCSRTACGVPIVASDTSSGYVLVSDEALFREDPGRTRLVVWRWRVITVLPPPCSILCTYCIRTACDVPIIANSFDSRKFVQNSPQSATLCQCQVQVQFSSSLIGFAYHGRAACVISSNWSSRYKPVSETPLA